MNVRPERTGRVFDTAHLYEAMNRPLINGLLGMPKPISDVSFANYSYSRLTANVQKGRDTAY